MSESDDILGNVPPQPPPPNGGGPQGPFIEQLQYGPVGARVPEQIGHGVFSTGAVVLEGPEEFIIDFIQGIAKPRRVGARVILNPRVMGQFVGALKDNLQKFEQSFGPPKPLPKPNPQQRPSISEMYKELKLPDEQLSGLYANTVMIAHSPAEFLFDFITRFFPTAAVSARVYMSASHVPQVLEALTSSYQHYMRQRGQQP